MNGKVSEQYGQVSDEERMQRRLGVRRTKKALSITDGPQIPLNVMAELQAKQNKTHLAKRGEAIAVDGEQNAGPNNNHLLHAADPQASPDKDDVNLASDSTAEVVSEEVTLEELPSDFIEEGSRFRPLQLLNLENITLKQLVELKLAISSKDRKLSIEQTGKKLNFTLTQRRLGEQLNSALNSLARKEVLGEDAAEALLKAYNTACKKIYKKQITKIEELFDRIIKSAYHDDTLKQNNLYDLNQVLDINLLRLFSEAQALTKNSKLVEASSLKECVASERQFKKDKLSAILKGLEALALRGNIKAEEKLGEYKTKIRFSNEVTRLKCFGDVYQCNHMNNYKLFEALEILGKQVAYPNDVVLRKMIQKYIANKSQCELNTVMRQGFALSIVKKMIDEDKTTTAKKVWFIQGAPQYNAGIKALFDRHKNDKFDEKNIQALADEVTAFLRDALLHYQAKPSDQRYSRKLRMWGDEPAKNDVIIGTLQSWLNLVEKTHPSYVPTQADTELSSEIDPMVNDFVAVSASYTSVQGVLDSPITDVSAIKGRGDQSSLDSEMGLSEESSFVDGSDLSGDDSAVTADDESQKSNFSNLLDLAPVDNFVATAMTFSSPSPTGSE